MRICFVSQEDIVRPPGGTGTYVRNMSIALAGRRHDVHVIVRQRDGAPAQEVVDGVSVHRVSAPGPAVLYSPTYFRRSRRKFLELTAGAPFDVVQGNLPLMSSWGLRGPGLPPFVETVHCTVREELRALTRASLRQLNFNEAVTRLLTPVLYHRERELLCRARRVIAVSHGLKRELVDQIGYPADNVDVIPNGIDFARFAAVTRVDRLATRKALGIDPDERVILYLGRLMERKRVVDLVRALPFVLQHTPQARLIVVGRRNSNAAHLEQVARDLGVGSKVRLIDHVPYRHVPGYYGMADVYALPSAYEGFPFTVLEAMASGVPVVASAIPGIDEQIVSGENGLLHRVGDIGAIAQAIQRVLEHAGFAARLAAAGRCTVAQNYTWDVIAGRTEQVLQGMV